MVAYSHVYIRLPIIFEVVQDTIALSLRGSENSLLSVQGQVISSIGPYCTQILPQKGGDTSGGRGVGGGVDSVRFDSVPGTLIPIPLPLCDGECGRRLQG